MCLKPGEGRLAISVTVKIWILGWMVCMAGDQGERGQWSSTPARLRARTRVSQVNSVNWVKSSKAAGESGSFDVLEVCPCVSALANGTWWTGALRQILSQRVCIEPAYGRSIACRADLDSVCLPAMFFNGSFRVVECRGTCRRVIARFPTRLARSQSLDGFSWERLSKTGRLSLSLQLQPNTRLGHWARKEHRLEREKTVYPLHLPIQASYPNQLAGFQMRLFPRLFSGLIEMSTVLFHLAFTQKVPLRQNGFIEN